MDVFHPYLEKKNAKFSRNKKAGEHKTDGEGKKKEGKNSEFGRLLRGRMTNGGGGEENLFATQKWERTKISTNGLTEVG